MLLEQFGFHGDSFLPMTLHAYEEVDSENNSAGEVYSRDGQEHQDMCCGLLSMFAICSRSIR